MRWRAEKIFFFQAGILTGVGLTSQPEEVIADICYSMVPKLATGWHEQTTGGPSSMYGNKQT